MRAALAAALLLVSQTAPPGLLYDFEWRSSAMLSLWEGGDTVTKREELAGKGRLRLTRLRDGRWHFAFWSAEGQGEGDVTGDRLETATFPVPLDVGRPAAPPHLTSGTFKAVGDPERPTAFELTWAEGFICRTTPATCGNVTAWARELTGYARLIEMGGPDMPPLPPRMLGAPRVNRSAPL
jgi:hypothetical protein